MQTENSFFARKNDAKFADVKKKSYLCTRIVKNNL